MPRETPWTRRVVTVAKNGFLSFRGMTEEMHVDKNTDQYLNLPFFMHPRGFRQRRVDNHAAASDSS